MNMGFMAAIIAANAAAMKNQRERDAKIRKEKDMQEYKDKPKENIRGYLTMAKKFIDVEETLKRLQDLCADGNMWGDENLTLVDYAQVEETILDMPAADVQEVRHGKWVHCIGNRDPRDDFYECSICGRTINLICGNKITDYPYCHCGAKMDGGNEND